MTQLIETNDPYSHNGDYYAEHDEEQIAALLEGHRVTKVADDHLQLDDGTVLKFIGNDGGCACSAGCYDLTELNGVDNIITKVEVVDERTADEWQEYGGKWRINVYAGHQKLNLATFEGDDGNGYYGTGFQVLVQREV